MTEGTIWKSIVAFAIPLFLGNLFQQLYNMADSLIVGNFLGSNALAAVSSSGNLIFLLVGFFNGIAVGAGVVIARYFGAREKESLQRSIHTTIAFGLICGVVLSLVGVIFAPKILILMGTPDEVLPNSTVYFQVYFAGSIFFVMYNIFVGILQAVGDSRHPLYYLIISSITNVILDLILVAGFRFGVGAAALATTISQALSAALCLRQLLRSPEEYRVSLKKIRLDFFMLRQIISNGLPGRPSELHHCLGQRGGSVQHQLLWKNGHGRLRFLLKSGGLRFSPRDLLCPVHDHLHQPEYRCEEI